MYSKLLILLVCCSASCAKWCDILPEGDDSNSDSTNNATATTNNETMAPAADCSSAAIGQTIPYDAGGALPFSFEINARFGNIDTSDAGVVSGATFDVVDAMPGDFEAAYVVKREPVENPNTLQTEWESRSREPTSISFDGTMISAWTFESDERDAVYFMAPHDGDVFEASLEWTGPTDCLEERRALRDLALSSLMRVDETSFP